MAFDDELGFDGSQQIDQNYTLSATGVVSRTISLWSRKIVQYIMIVGIASAVCIALSLVLLNSIFGIFDTIVADPIGYLIGFLLNPLSNIPLLTLSVGFAIFAFVLNSIIFGAAIKFTLDEYGGTGGDVGFSFSRSLGRLLHVIFIQIIISFIVSIIVTPSSFFAFQALDMIDLTDPFNPIIPPGALELMMYSMAILFVGGIFLIYMQVRFAPALAVVIDTELSAIDSLKKSWELTSGNFFHVFGSYILMVVAIAVLGLLVSVAITFTFLPTYIAVVIEAIITALLFGSLNFIFAVVLYRDLSSRAGAVSSSLDELML